MSAPRKRGHYKFTHEDGWLCTDPPPRKRVRPKKDPKPQKTREKRFWEKVVVRSSDECWPWKKTPTVSQQWKFWDGTRAVAPRRWIYEQKNGTIPQGKDVRHKSDRLNRSFCVNPSHLYLAEAVYRKPAPAAHQEDPSTPAEGCCSLCNKPLDRDPPKCTACLMAESQQRYRERHANDN